AIEAVACGLRVDGCDAGGRREVIDHGVTGFLPPVGSVGPMADSGVALLSDGELHQRIAGAAVRAVRERFCAERVVPMYEAHYERALGTVTRDPWTVTREPGT